MDLKLNPLLTTGTSAHEAVVWVANRQIIQKALAFQLLKVVF